MQLLLSVAVVGLLPLVLGTDAFSGFNWSDQGFIDLAVYIILSAAWAVILVR